MKTSHTTFEYAVASTKEVVRIALYQGSPTSSDIVVLIAGYYTGAHTLTPIAMAINEAGFTVAIIETYGAPTWIDKCIPFDDEVPPLMQKWTSVAMYGLEKIHETYPKHTVHLLGFSMGGPAALLASIYMEHTYRSLTLIAPIGIQGPIERVALILRRHMLTAPLGYALSRALLLWQLIKISTYKTIMSRVPHLKLRYHSIAHDKAIKINEGAKRIGYEVGVVKLEFYIGQFLEKLNAGKTSLTFIGHTNDTYIHGQTLKDTADKLGIPCILTRGDHNRAKTHPEEIASIVLEHIARTQ